MRMIRFITPDRGVLHGEHHEDGTATVLRGSIVDGFARSNERIEVSKLLAPVEPADIICIGRNYKTADAASGDEREEDGGDAQSNHRHDDATLEVFLKPSTAIQHPSEAIFVPQFEDLDPQLDCEGELAVIIGRETRDVSETDVLQHVFGYTIANDVTARRFQTPAGPPIWMRGKGFDAFCPLGPAIITADEIPDPQTLAIRTIINGVVTRDGNTRDMIRPVANIIATLSRHMTLRAGAVILTGAPPVRVHQDSHTSICRVVIDIERIGRLENPVERDSHLRSKE